MPPTRESKRKMKEMYRDGAIKKVTNGKKTKMSELTIAERIQVEFECDKQIKLWKF